MKLLITNPPKREKNQRLLPIILQCIIRFNSTMPSVHKIVKHTFKIYVRLTIS